MRGSLERYRDNALNTCRFERSARTEWTTGKENFPSDKSSAKDLFVAYLIDDDLRSIIDWAAIHSPRLIGGSYSHLVFERGR